MVIVRAQRNSLLSILARGAAAPLEGITPQTRLTLAGEELYPRGISRDDLGTEHVLIVGDFPEIPGPFLGPEVSECRYVALLREATDEEAQPFALRPVECVELLEVAACKNGQIDLRRTGIADPYVQV